MSKIFTGLVIGLIFGAVIGAFIGSTYYRDQIKSINKNYQNESSTIEHFFQDQIENINQLLDNSEYDYSELENEKKVIENDYFELQEDYDELTQKYDKLMDQYSLMLGELPLTPERTSTELIAKDYTWNYLGESWKLELSIPKSIADFYENHDRIPTDDYSVYVTHPFDDEYLKTVIEKMNLIAIQKDLTESEKVNLLISFVQSLPYTYDNISTPYDEYPRFPIETLVYGGGDCEDTSILTAALLFEMNYGVILINPPGHMAVGINMGNSGSYWTFESVDYYYLETTGEGWSIGECPEKYQDSAYLYGLTPMPVISHTWEAQWNSTQLDISITIENEGTTIAEEYSVWVAFDAGGGYVWNQVESDPFALQFGREIVIDLTLDVPREEYTRLIVEILDQDGYYINQSYSEWFYT